MPHWQAIQTDQRYQLRVFYNSTIPCPIHKQCIEWFEQAFAHHISQSTVSESLSATFAWLDGNNTVDTIKHPIRPDSF